MQEGDDEIVALLQPELFNLPYFLTCHLKSRPETAMLRRSEIFNRATEFEIHSALGKTLDLTMETWRAPSFRSLAPPPQKSPCCRKFPSSHTRKIRQQRLYLHADLLGRNYSRVPNQILERNPGLVKPLSLEISTPWCFGNELQ